jgi:myo-inositol-1(or 4)-monophosphatase
MLDRIKSTAIECATSAGKRLLQHFGKVRNVQVKESQSSIVTEADLASEQHILSIIRSRFPQHNIVAEETGFQDRGSAYTWVVDPLDGTSNFAAGLPWFGVLVNVLEHGEPLIATMYLPIEDRLYVGQRGQGVTRNGEPVRVTTETRWPHLLCAYGMDASSDAEQVRRQSLLLGGLVRLARNVRATNSLIDFAYTIDGRLGAVVNLNTKIWDIAAPALLLPEAGGQLTDLRGAPIQFKLDATCPERSYAVVGGAPSLCRQVLEQVATAGQV